MGSASQHSSCSLRAAAAAVKEQRSSQRSSGDRHRMASAVLPHSKERCVAVAAMWRVLKLRGCAGGFVQYGYVLPLLCT